MTDPKNIFIAKKIVILYESYENFLNRYARYYIDDELMDKMIYEMS